MKAVALAQTRRVFVAIAVLLVSVGVGPVHGEVAWFLDKEEWLTAVGPITTIDFTGFPQGTFITDQYADLGATFTDGNDSIYLNDSFKNDGAGLKGNGNINVAFDTPQLWVAVDFPGLIQIDLFSAGDLIYESPWFGSAGNGFFAGLLSSDSFDAVRLHGDISAYIDDLHYGIPAPATLVLLGLAALAPRRRRLLPAS